ncbi:NUDIX hydrolase [Thiomonas sp.]
MTAPPPSRPPFDPEQVPLSTPEPGMPAVDPAHLQAGWLRSRFARTPSWRPEVFEDVQIGQHTTLRDASVLIPLIARPQGMQLLLTRRTANLHVHPGQISFPGGSRDAGDASALHTALREAEEEIGLQAAWVEPLGSMPVYTTITGYAVTPVVGMVDPQAPLRAQASEVAEVFEVPLAFLMNPAHHELRTWDAQTGLGALPTLPNAARRSFYAMPWTSTDGRRYFIWGATAAMIRNLYRLLIA